MSEVLSVSDKFKKFLNDESFPYMENWVKGGLEFDIEVPPRPEDAFVDWLRCTNTDINAFFEFTKYLLTRLKSMGFEVHDTGKGLSGYTHCFAITFNSERVGSICADALDKMGGLFELTGTGCSMLQAHWGHWCSLMYSLKISGFSITRLDVSYDFKGAAWYNYNKTIVDFLRLANSGKFSMGRGPSPKITQNGDWTGLILGDCRSYVPWQEKEGLSFSVGTRSSINSILFYEKMKQLAGTGAFDTLTKVEASAVRAERRFTRGTGSSKVVIPFEFAIHCDDAFVYNCPGMQDFIREFKEWVSGRSDWSAGSGIGFERIVKHQAKKVLKKTFWAANHAGRLIKTLLELSFSPGEIVSFLAAEDTIPGYIDNISEVSDIASELKRIKKYEFSKSAQA